MKKTIIATAVLMASISGAHASGLTGQVGITSDYVLRGISQSDNGPALQASVGYGVGNLSGGVFASSVNFNDGDQASVELSPFINYRVYANEDFAVDIGGIYYTYPGANSGLGYDYGEMNAAISGKIMGATVTGKVSYSPDFFGNLGSATYTELGASMPAWFGTTVFASAGYQDFSRAGVQSIVDYKVGASKSFGALTAEVAWTDTNMNNNLADSRINASVKVAF
jgi:uncharacterized protein (TIGR02001 family)